VFAELIDGRLAGSQYFLAYLYEMYSESERERDRERYSKEMPYVDQLSSGGVTKVRIAHHPQNGVNHVCKRN
jgi:hypothetical protein